MATPLVSTLCVMFDFVSSSADKATYTPIELCEYENGKINASDTCSRNFYRSFVQETGTTRNLHKKIWRKLITVVCTKSTLHPITLNGLFHVPNSFWAVIELRSTACKKLVSDWPTHMHFLYKTTCTSFWYKFPESVSPA